MTMLGIFAIIALCIAIIVILFGNRKQAWITTTVCWLAAGAGLLKNGDSEGFICIAVGLGIIIFCVIMHAKGRLN